MKKKYRVDCTLKDIRVQLSISLTLLQWLEFEKECHQLGKLNGEKIEESSEALKTSFLQKWFGSEMSG